MKKFTSQILILLISLFLTCSAFRLRTTQDITRENVGEFNHCGTTGNGEDYLDRMCYFSDESWISYSWRSEPSRGFFSDTTCLIAADQQSLCCVICQQNLGDSQANCVGEESCPDLILRTDITTPAPGIEE